MNTPATSKVYELEHKVLKYSGLELDKDLFVYDVSITINDKVHKLHTYRCGSEDAEALVLLHGYGGCSALYYPMLKALSKIYRVFCLDFIGMGLSSKEKFECTSTDETIAFLVGSIEKWREAVGLESFYLAGHSFGGYISGQYALHHQDRVKQLLLLSPIGITKQEKEVTVEEVKRKMGFFQRWIVGYAVKAIENKSTPVTMMHDHPCIGKYFLGRYVYKRFNLKNEEAATLKQFMLEMMKLPEGAEKAIHYVLKPPMMSAYYPLEDRIAEELKMPVSVWFGEKDYLDSTGAKRIIEKNQHKQYNFKILSKADHQLPMQNPNALAEQMIECLAVEVIPSGV